MAAFDAYLDEWTAQLDDEVFEWQGEVDADLLRHLAAHWARLANLARDAPEETGLAIASPEAEEFYDALAAGMADALVRADDAERFAPKFEEIVPAFDAGGRGDVTEHGDDDRAPHSVLLVDDNADIRLLVRIGLESSGQFTIAAEACDGEEAIAALVAGCPDMILLDLTMPVMDGMTALPLLLERCPSSRIVVFSANDTADVRDQALRLGASAFIRKDAGITDIIRTLAAF